MSKEKDLYLKCIKCGNIQQFFSSSLPETIKCTCGVSCGSDRYRSLFIPITKSEYDDTIKTLEKRGKQDKFGEQKESMSRSLNVNEQKQNRQLKWGN